jgi:hypothetical protein
MMQIISIRYKLDQLGFALNFGTNYRNWVSCFNCDKLALNWYNYNKFHGIEHESNIN